MSQLLVHEVDTSHTVSTERFVNHGTNLWIWNVFCIMLRLSKCLDFKFMGTDQSSPMIVVSEKELITTTIWPVSTCDPPWEWQSLCKASWYVCEIYCSAFSEVESPCKSGQAPLEQIRLSGRYRSLCHTHKSLSHNKRADIHWISHCHSQKIQNWVISSTFLMTGTG